MPAWPANIELFTAGLTETRQNGFIRTPMETGPPKHRRRYSAVSRFLQGETTWTRAQRTSFETFYTGTIAEGSSAFDYTDPHDGSTKSARFVEPPEITHLFGDGTLTAYYTVRLNLELLP